MGFAFARAQKAALAAAGNVGFAIELLASGMEVFSQDSTCILHALVLCTFCTVSDGTPAALDVLAEAGRAMLAGQAEDAGIPEMKPQAEIDDLCCVANSLNITTSEVEKTVMKHHGNHQEAMKVHISRLSQLACQVHRGLCRHLLDSNVCSHFWNICGTDVRCRNTC